MKVTTRPAVTPPVSRLHGPLPVLPEPQDQFTASSPESFSDRRGWLQATMVMVVAGGALMAPLAPLSAQVAASSARNTQGVHASKISKTLQEPRVSAMMHQFPKEFQDQARQMSDAQLQVLFGGVSGTTKIGPLSINNRDAFIKGSFMGKSVWKNVHQSITDAQMKYKMIGSGEAQALHQIVDQAARFTPQQRAMLADLVMVAQRA